MDNVAISVDRAAIPGTLVIWSNALPFIHALFGYVLRIVRKTRATEKVNAFHILSAHIAG